MIESFESSPPNRIYEIIKLYFHKDKQTIDVSPSSRSTAFWLNKHGYLDLGVESSLEMVSDAPALYTKIDQIRDPFAKIRDITEPQFNNLLCIHAITSIPQNAFVETCLDLLRILRMGGVAIISYNNEASENKINFSKLSLLFESIGGEILFKEKHEEREQGRIWNTIVVRKVDSANRDGVQKVQEIIVRDKKTATYKLALLRSLCEISRFEPYSVIWSNSRTELDDTAYIPLKRIAVCWLRYYFPLIKHEHPIVQTTSASGRLGFQETVEQLDYGLNDFGLLVKDLDDTTKQQIFNQVLRRISSVIKNGPIKHSGEYNSPVFHYCKVIENQSSLNDEMGYMSLPAKMWRDICLFSHWIEDSLLIQWARLTEKINNDSHFGRYLSLLTTPVYQERTTTEIRNILQTEFSPSIKCVWTGEYLTSNKFDVDHVVPYSIWLNNDLWNLLPANSRINNQKRDKIPSSRLIKNRKDAIISYWETYNQVRPELFFHQISRSLGCLNEKNWELDAIQGLIEVTERLASTRGLERFDI